MKRKLLVLSILFLGLWVVCLFNPGTSPAMHIALVVELVFFVHYLVTKKLPVIETSEAVVINEPEQKTETSNEIKRGNPDMPQSNVIVNKQEVEVFS